MGLFLVLTIIPAPVYPQCTIANPACWPAIYKDHILCFKNSVSRLKFEKLLLLSSLSSLGIRTLTFYWHNFIVLLPLDRLINTYFTVNPFCYKLVFSFFLKGRYYLKDANLEFLELMMIIDVICCFCCFILQSIFNGMQVYFVPYSLMKVNPASWMHIVTKYKGKKLFSSLSIFMPCSKKRSCTSGLKSPIQS